MTALSTPSFYFVSLVSFWYYSFCSLPIFCFFMLKSLDHMSILYCLSLISFHWSFRLILLVLILQPLLCQDTMCSQLYHIEVSHVRFKRDVVFLIWNRANLPSWASFGVWVRPNNPLFTHHNCHMWYSWLPCYKPCC